MTSSPSEFTASTVSVLQSPFVAFTVPLIHYQLLKASPRWLANILVFSYILTVPLIRMEESEAMLPMFTAIWVFMGLRLADAGLGLEDSIIQKMSFMHFIEYVLAFRVNPSLVVRKEDDESGLSRKATINDKSVPYENLFESGYIKQTVLGLSWKTAFFLCSMYYISFKEWSPTPFQIVDFSDPVLAFDYLLLGLCLMMALDVGCSISNHILAIIFKLPYVPVMNNPIIATSIRDFWVRWNLIVQRALRSIVFEPTLAAFGYKNKKPTVGVAMIAGVATFAFSGLMHEWIIKSLCIRATTWEQMLFFTLQGFIVLAEVIVEKSFKMITGFALKKVVPWPVQIMYTMAVCTIFAPLFHNIFILDGTYYRFLPSF